MSVEGLRSGVAPHARPRSIPRARAAGGWLRERLATTPGRLVLISILVVVGAVCFGAIAISAEQSRARAAQAARTETEPLLVQAVRLYSALSDANATVATGLLSGGLEPPAKRARYLADLRVASNALSTLTREAGTSARVPTALGTVADQLPVYSGLVESARANNRQNLPIGAAYLRQAATLLTTSVLPAADRLYVTEAERLNADYHTGTETTSLATFLVASVVALVLLVLAQWYLARVSRRILNVPMVVATVAVAAVAVWGVVALVSEQNALATAQRSGSDSVEVLSAATVLLSRAQGDLSLTLVNRGSDVTDPLDFAAVTRALAPARRTGVLAELSALARRTGTSAAAQRVESDYAAYRAKATQIDRLEGRGDIGGAIALAPAASAISDQLGNDLDRQTAAAQQRFAHAAGDATSDLDGLGFVIPLVTAVAAGLALFGLGQRINEYR